MYTVNKNRLQNNKRLTLLVVFLYCCLYSATAQDYDTSNPHRNNSTIVDVNIFNRYDDHLIDTTYMSNKEMFFMLDSLMRDTTIINHTQQINVVSSSSIEGSVPYNTALSRRRMQNVEATLRSRYNYIAEDVWSFDYIPENWSHLRRAVSEDSSVPSQQAVLSIIDMESRHADTREYMLKALNGGVPWRYIHQNILPSSRGSVSVLFVPINIIPLNLYKSIPPQCVESPLVDLLPLVPSASPAHYLRPIVSIRSNLLLDATSTLNIAVELPLAPRWSVSAEYINPWWKNWDRALTWQIQSLYFDLRYWLSPRGLHNYLNGWSVGVYAGSGCYDLQPLSPRGVQGEYTDYGVTLSYAHNLGQSKHWLMEYTAALGYVTTHYRHYYTATDTDEYGNIKVHFYPWSEETLRTLLPTRLGVTLCYLIYVKGRKWGGVV